MDLGAVTTLAAISDTGIQNAGKAIALGVGAGLGSIGAGIGIGLIFASEIESVARQPEMRNELQSIRWLGFALTEAVAFYTFIFGLIAFFLQVDALANTPVLGAGSGGSFLVSPGLGLMIWTLIAFGATFLILRKYAYPLISDALDKRRRQIEESIEYAARMRSDADELLEEYRARLREAREQAEDILIRSRKAAEAYEQEAKERSRAEHQEALERTRREIEAETRRALDEIRKEVAELTIIATEKVARKSLDGDDQKRLIEEALAEVDFSAFASEGDGRNN